MRKITPKFYSKDQSDHAIYAVSDIYKDKKMKFWKLVNQSLYQYYSIISYIIFYNSITDYLQCNSKQYWLRYEQINVPQKCNI